MRTGIITVVIILSVIALFLCNTSFALTTEELLQLKKAGVPEDIILFMVDSDYKDVDKVLKLKDAGFKDETILSIIKKDLKEKPSSEILRNEPARSVSVQGKGAETPSKIKILWYASYGGGPVLLAKQEEDNARIAVEAGTLKFEWADKNVFSILIKKPFKSPFFWDINKDDTFGAGKEGYAYMLKSTVNHKGKPDTDASHYWTIYLEPKDTKIVDYIKESLSNR
jgi:hypothetical protein